MRDFIINDKNEGKKLFRFIKAVLPGLKNNEIFKMLRKKIISVNGKKKDPDYILNKDDVIKIFLKDEHFDKKGKKQKFSGIDNKPEIAFEDDDILVINKKKGVLSQPAENEYKNSIFEIARSYLYSKGKYKTDDVFNPTPCHRLDKNTSGLIVIAKNQKSLVKITSQFRERKILKTYLAFVYGRVNKEVLLVSNLNQSENKVTSDKLKKYEIIPERKDFLLKNPDISATHLIPLEVGKNLSLVKVSLWTGKKHQIRVHLAKYGNPLIGDRKYSALKSEELSKKINVRSFFLHAWKLEIPGYSEISAPIPEDFQSIISKYFK